MMNELYKFKETAISHGVCDEYLGKWNKATSKKELIDIALSSEGCEFMCSSKNNIPKRYESVRFSSRAISESSSFWE